MKGIDNQLDEAISIVQKDLKKEQRYTKSLDSLELLLSHMFQIKMLLMQYCVKQKTPQERQT